MRILNLLAISSLSAAMLAACAPATGYYDSNGVYHSYDEPKPHPMIAGGPRPAPIAVPAYDTTTVQYNTNTPYTTTSTTRTYMFNRPGYYDPNGYYIAMDSGPVLAPEFLPPRGLCRVWIPSRAQTEQPPVESCDTIRSRIPAGAYVIYGGN